MERHERLKKAVEYLLKSGKLSKKKDLPSILNRRPETISRSLNGKNGNPTDDFFIIFNNAFGSSFNLDWLLKGDGDMLAEKTQEGTKTDGATNSSDENISMLLEQNKELIDVLKKSLEESQRTNNILLNELSELRKSLKGDGSVASQKTVAIMESH